MTHVAIIGAGPAGLATARALAERRVPFTLLDREGALAGLRRVDPETRLITPRALSHLPGMPRLSEDHATFAELVATLDTWRAGIPVTRRAVDAVTRDGAGFHVGDLAVTHVVNATGMIGQPHLPAVVSPAIRWLHSVDVRRAELASARRLLVVGAGMSAADVLGRWTAQRRADDRAWLSTRRPVARFGATPTTVLGVDVHWLTWAPEHLPGRLGGCRLGPRRDLAIGRAWLADDAIHQVPAIAGYADPEVTLVDGTRLAPDLIVYATGFRYVGAHLGALVARDRDGWPIVDRHAASTVAPRLYVLGQRFGRSLASPYLRGIARDATHVAARIASGA